MLSTQRLLQRLDQEHASLVEEADVGDVELLRQCRDAVAEVIGERGDVAASRDLDRLCVAIGKRLKALAAGNEELLDELTDLRASAKQDLRVEAKWAKEKMFQKGKITDHGLDILNSMRQLVGLGTFVREGQEFFTEDELRSFRAIAAELGEIAVAEFICALRPEKFAFNNRTIQNLRKWIGDIETYRGGSIDEVPVQLLVMPELRALRDLLFNRMRDKYYIAYNRDGLEGVLAELQESLERAAEEPRREFIADVMTYFREVDAMPHPARLKNRLITGDEFPAKHQKIAAKEIERQHQMLIADGMGGGKTGSAIGTFEYLRMQGKAKRALVLAPSEIINEWAKRLTSKEQGYFLPGQEPSVVTIRAGDDSREAVWSEAASADYVLMSIEMARSETAGVDHEEWARGIGADYFIVDEAHNVKNPNGGDTERVFRMSQCDSIRNGYTVLLSGTPVPNKITDIAAQLRLLNAGQERVSASAGVPSGVDFMNIKSLTKAITRNHTRLVRNLLLLRMLHRDTEDCLPVGTEVLIEEPRAATMNPIEQAFYDAIYEDPFYTATQKIQMLRRLCLHDNARNPSLRAPGTGATKLAELRSSIDEFLAELDDNPGAHTGKILIASGGYKKGVTSDFDDNNDAATSRQSEYLAGKIRMEYEAKGVKVFILDGSNTGTTHLRGDDGTYLYDIDGSPMTETRKLIAQVRDYDGPALFFTRTDVIGEGIDLSFMSRGILLCPTQTISERDQFVRRMYRRGQKNNVVLRTLMTDGSIEKGMAEYAAHKQKIIWDLINGRPLTKVEEEMLNEDASSVRRGGHLAYETMSPAEKVMKIFRMMMGAGKERVREIFEADGGKFAKELAAHYHDDWETTLSGNNARLIASLVRTYVPSMALSRGAKARVADVACGGLAMANMLRDDEDVEVLSSDINPHMVEIGKSLMNGSAAGQRVDIVPMDELPYESGSVDIAVHSLALHYTKHSYRVGGASGMERMRALSELNRILRPGGVAFLTLPSFACKDPGRFREIRLVLETYFGFTLVEKDSGRAYGLDEEDTKSRFETYVFTLAKSGPVADLGTIPPEAWRALQFVRRKRATGFGATEPSDKKAAKKDKQSTRAFHTVFGLGNDVVTYVPSEKQGAALRDYQEGKRQYERVVSRVEALLEEYGSIGAIPDEKLLSLSLTDVDEAEQRVKDEYFAALMRRYGGIENIPLDEISKHSPIILLPGETKRRGAFLVLGMMDGKKVRSYGKRYFYENEMRGDDDPPEKRKTA